MTESISLEKGQRIELTKGTGIKKIKLACGWNPNIEKGGSKFDLDAYVLFLNKDGKLQNGRSDMLFFNTPNRTHPSGAAIHSGDNLTGEGEGDDEVITIDLTKVPEYTNEIKGIISIFEASERRQNFGLVNSAFGRIVNGETNVELCRIDLTEDKSTSKTVYVGRVYRHNGEWKFEALDKGFEGEIGDVENAHL